MSSFELPKSVALIPLGIQQLDPKISFEFLPEGKYENGHALASAIRGFNNTGIPIWQVDQFLNWKECETIISNLEKCPSLSTTSFGSNRSRLLAFDSNNELMHLFQARLQNDFLWDRLASNHVEPYGFHSTDRGAWSNKDIILNPCIRANKYSSGGFIPWHRDAQYTSGVSCLKSNYTLLVFLNDCSSGSTKFRLVNDSGLRNKLYSGLSVAEELAMINSCGVTTRDIEIQPKQGTAVIFDQKILHCSSPLESGSKYTLRTDILCRGPSDVQDTHGGVASICRKIFRQAQYEELMGNQSTAGDLYERAINLRQYRFPMPVREAHTKQILRKLNVGQEVPHTCLTFETRSGEETEFSFRNPSNIPKTKLVILAALYTFLHETSSMVKTSQKLQDLWEDCVSKLDFLAEDASDEKEPPAKRRREESSEDEDSLREFKNFPIFKAGDEPEGEDDIDEHCSASEKRMLELLSSFRFIQKLGLKTLSDVTEISEKRPEESAPPCVKLQTELEVVGFKGDGEYCGFAGNNQCCDEHEVPDQEFANPISLKIDVVIGSLIFQFQRVEILTDGSMTGAMEFSSPGSSFNHASCQCSSVIDVDSLEIQTRYGYITTSFEFFVSDNIIRIKYEPKVSV